MQALRIRTLMRVAAVAAALALGGLAAQAQPGPDRHGAPPDMMAAGIALAGSCASNGSRSSPRPTSTPLPSSPCAPR